MIHTLNETYVLMCRELKRWYRSKVLLIATIIQPVLWLGLFGKAMNITGMFNIPEEILEELPPSLTSKLSILFNSIIKEYFGVANIDYFSYMAMGMITVIILFTSMFSGMSIVWDRRFGFLNKLLVAPISRSSILLSRVFASVIRALVQAFLISLIALAFGLKLNICNNPVVIPLAILTLILLAVGLSSFFIAIAARIKSWEVHAGVMNLINMPLMFSSNVLYPKKLMPNWLKGIASVNPLSFTADILRQAFLYGSNANLSQILLDFEAILIFSLLLTSICILIANKALKEI